MSFSGEVTIGRFNRLDVKVAANLPASLTLRWRVTGAIINRNGYVRRLVNDGLPNHKKRRLADQSVAESSPAENSEATFAVVGTRVRETAVELEDASHNSISSYCSANSSSGIDIDQSTFIITNSSKCYRQKQFRQELQLSVAAFGDCLSYLSGLCHLRKTGIYIDTRTTSIASFSSGGRVAIDSYAALSKPSYKLADRLIITVDACYSAEPKRLTPDQGVIGVKPAGQAPLLLRAGNRILSFVRASTSVRRFTPPVSMDFEPTDGMLLCTSYSRESKSGGFPQRIHTPEPANPSFGPETDDIYEFGVKLELLGRRVRWNSPVFQNDCGDVQVLVAEGFVLKVRNAGQARIRGFGSEVEAVLPSRCRFNASLGHLDARYLSASVPAAPVTVNSRLVNTPEWLISAGATFDVPQADWGDISQRGIWSYRTNVAKDTENTPRLIPSGCHIIGAKLTYRSPDERRQIAVGGISLANIAFPITGNSNPLFTESYGEGCSAPREFYVKVGVDF